MPPTAVHHEFVINMFISSITNKTSLNLIQFSTLATLCRTKVDVVNSDTRLSILFRVFL